MEEIRFLFLSTLKSIDSPVSIRDMAELLGINYGESKEIAWSLVEQRLIKFDYYFNLIAL